MLSDGAVRCVLSASTVATARLSVPADVLAERDRDAAASMHSAIARSRHAADAALKAFSGKYCLQIFIGGQRYDKISRFCVKNY